MSPVFNATNEHRYNYHMDTFIETWIGPQRKIIFQTECDASSLRNATLISHENFLDCLFVNEKDRHIIYDYVGSSLADATNQWEIGENQNRVVKFTLPTINLHSTDWNQCFYLHPKIRGQLCTMIRFVQYVHLQQLNIILFNLDNLMIDDNGIVKFRVALISDDSVRAQALNYQNLATALRSLMGYNNV